MQEFSIIKAFNIDCHLSMPQIITIVHIKTIGLESSSHIQMAENFEIVRPDIHDWCSIASHFTLCV
jgi:hypothetical protein